LSAQLNQCFFVCAVESGFRAGSGFHVWLDEAEGVRRIGGDVETYYLLLGDFLRDYAPRVAQLWAQWMGGTWAEVGVLTHRLRGTAPMLGAAALAARAAELDDSIREGHTPSVAAVTDFLEALAGTLEAVRELTAAGEPGVCHPA
jgi:two-component system, sensor histidine kinase and response regulator